MTVTSLLPGYWLPDCMALDKPFISQAPSSSVNAGGEHSPLLQTEGGVQGGSCTGLACKGCQAPVN